MEANFYISGVDLFFEDDNGNTWKYYGIATGGTGEPGEVYIISNGLAYNDANGDTRYIPESSRGSTGGLENGAVFMDAAVNRLGWVRSGLGYNSYTQPHSDTYSNVSFSNSHTNTSHSNTYSNKAFQNNHSDVAHSNVSHSDTAHSNTHSNGHTNRGYPFGNSHSNTYSNSHSDVAHSNTHSDSGYNNSHSNSHSNFYGNSHSNRSHSDGHSNIAPNPVTV